MEQQAEKQEREEHQKHYNEYEFHKKLIKKQNQREMASYYNYQRNLKQKQDYEEDMLLNEKEFYHNKPILQEMLPNDI